jgi:protein-L-isoaspartate(D-aspartate) O-methyltransferase
MDLGLARTNMIKSQLIPNQVQDERLLDVLGQVPREAFVAPAYRSFAYSDYPLPLGEGSRRMLKPLQSVWMIQSLQAQPDERILVVGAGSGYEAAVLAKMGAKVYALESQRELVESGRQEASHTDISWHVGPLAAGWPEQQPFDAILLCGAVPEVPRGLVQQLDAQGRLICIVGKPGASVMRAIQVWGQDHAGQPETLFDTVATALPGFETRSFEL